MKKGGDARLGNPRQRVHMLCAGKAKDNNAYADSLHGVIPH